MTREELLATAGQKYDEVPVLVLASAIDYAAEKHAGQKRKSGEPYINHPLAVAGILIEWGMDIDTVVAGVLHDTVEDTDATLDELESLFGRDVAFLVDGVTKVSQARAGMRSLDSYLPHTKDNLTKLMIAVGEDVRVIIIKLADRLHNMRTLQFMSPEKQKKIARETIEVFEARLKEEKLVFQMDGRVKSVYSLFKKLDKVGDIDKIYDLIALRVIVDDLSTGYLVLGILHDMYQPMHERIKDYVANPKPNGYQSLHTTVQTPRGQIVEFQIRTKEMHEHAERGLAASFHYNEQKLTDAYKKGRMGAMPADLSWIRDLQEAAALASEGKRFDSDKFRMKLFSDRIFVYSPKGDIYDLPRGAFPLDYAYRIHSDIAAHASGFKVNGVMKPFTYELQHGDVVEVLTSKSAKPKPAWRDMVITPHAKAKLRMQLSRSGGVLAHLTGLTDGVSSLFRR